LQRLETLCFLSLSLSLALFLEAEAANVLGSLFWWVCFTELLSYYVQQERECTLVAAAAALESAGRLLGAAEYTARHARLAYGSSRYKGNKQKKESNKTKEKKELKQRDRRQAKPYFGDIGDLGLLALRASAAMSWAADASG
jgi:hypothetical protein